MEEGGLHRCREGSHARSERYRYTAWRNGTVELYDHDTDPHEFTNLARDPKHAETLAEMKRLMSNGWKGAVADSAK